MLGASAVLHCSVGLHAGRSSGAAHFCGSGMLVGCISSAVLQRRSACWAQQRCSWFLWRWHACWVHQRCCIAVLVCVLGAAVVLLCSFGLHAGHSGSTVLHAGGLHAGHSSGAAHFYGGTVHVACCSGAALHGGGLHVGCSGSAAHFCGGGMLVGRTSSAALQCRSACWAQQRCS